MLRFYFLLCVVHFLSALACYRSALSLSGKRCCCFRLCSAITALCWTKIATADAKNTGNKFTLLWVCLEMMLKIYRNQEEQLYDEELNSCCSSYWAICQTAGRKISLETFTFMFWWCWGKNRWSTVSCPILGTEPVIYWTPALVSNH